MRALEVSAVNRFLRAKFVDFRQSFKSNAKAYEVMKTGRKLLKLAGQLAREIRLRRHLMRLSCGEVTEGVLTRHPQWYNRFTRREKIIVFNMLLAEGKYFDVKKCAVVKPTGSMTMGELRDATGLS